ncbi:MAG: sigma 54-interacting transcriptional regulator [Nitrospira sp.]|nr:sigma 54-interacting transcriptional regulator [Nitrospira sp.]MDH5496722.1 sigma 54-interacting transcriptional regulator [Nitrospira sp.]
MRAWFRIFSAGQVVHNLHDVFHRAGIDLYTPDEPLSGPGLAIVNEFDPRLRNFLQEARQAGVVRIIAINLPADHASGPATWSLLRAGVCDVLNWDRPDQTACAVAARLARWQIVDTLVTSSEVQNTLVGQSPVALSVLRQLVEAAYFTDSTILLMGESGTGKELAARLIHSLDQRANKGDLVVLDCTTVVPELSGSEFFGHERGAFTGAVTARDGAFALANGGTLFLDEVGDLPLGLQGQLLRVIQERCYKRVGGNTWHRTDFRLICATNRDLRQDIGQGRFRSDLYYRIAGDLFTIPPLRRRAEDILPLARHFTRSFSADSEPPEFDEAVRECFMLRDYPGNIRDLKQLVARIMRRYVGSGPITAGCLPEEERPERGEDPLEWCNEDFERCIRCAIARGIGLKDIGRTAENVAVRIAVADEQGNLQRAAARLRVTDRALQLRQAAVRPPDRQTLL